MSETKLPDIVERLHKADKAHLLSLPPFLLLEAAAEITRLRAHAGWHEAKQQAVSDALCRNQLNGTAIVCAGVCEGCTVPSQPHPCEHAVTVWGSDADEVLRALLQGEAAPPPNKEK